ncbi:MAG: hypothetical protein KDD61_17320 [Bdellovibrionales bacterium]|nr:hypothetical protein [Bdellovibrionales bacterium]
MNPLRLSIFFATFLCLGVLFYSRLYSVSAMNCLDPKYCESIHCKGVEIQLKDDRADDGSATFFCFGFIEKASD